MLSPESNCVYFNITLYLLRLRIIKNPEILCRIEKHIHILTSTAEKGNQFHVCFLHLLERGGPILHIRLLVKITFEDFRVKYKIVLE